MRKHLLAVGLAGLCAVSGFEAACAQQSLTVHPSQRRFDVPLPRIVTTNDNWLDMGDDNDVPVGTENRYAHMDNNDTLDDIPAGPSLKQNW